MTSDEISVLLDKFEEYAYQLGVSHGKKICGVYSGTDAIMDLAFVKSIEDVRKNLRALLEEKQLELNDERTNSRYLD